MKNIILALMLLSTSVFARTANDVYRMPSSGNIPGWGAIARQALPTVGQQISSSSGGSFSITTSTATDVTNLNVSITTTGRPVVIDCIWDGGTVLNSGVFSLDTSGASGSNLNGIIIVKRDSTIVSSVSFGNTFASNSTAYTVTLPSSAGCHYLDAVGAGTYTYKIQASLQAGAHLVAQYMKLAAYEL